MFSGASKKRRIEELEKQVALSTAKSRDVIANVSHELRTPVAALLAMTENLNDGITSWTPATGKQMLEYAEKLSNTISFMLDLSRVDSKTQELEIEELDAFDFVNDCIDEIKHADIAKDIQFIIEADPRETVFVDKSRFSAAIVNLLNNAIKFSPKEGEIIIEVFHEKNGKNAQEETVINVCDFGPGIDDAKKREVFNRFYSSAVDSRENATGGTGIGLSIVQWICELHGGTICVLSDNTKTTGAAFQIRLPR